MRRAVRTSVPDDKPADWHGVGFLFTPLWRWFLPFKTPARPLYRAHAAPPTLLFGRLKALAKFAFHPWFDNFILLNIIVSCTILCLKTYKTQTGVYPTLSYPQEKCTHLDVWPLLLHSLPYFHPAPWHAAKRCRLSGA